MAEQSGIGVLCDAVFASASTPDQSQQPLVKKPKKAADTGGPHHPATSSSTPTSTPNHVCHICKRVYERADHLTRHLRSHENARQYSCTRCPKRFNRADLLTRHETTHDRESHGGGRMIRRTDRAVEACAACSTAKAKCEDQKPCSRCKSKDLVCEMPPKKSQKYRMLLDGNDISQHVTGFPPSSEAMMLPADMPHPPYHSDSRSNATGTPNPGFVDIHNHFGTEPMSAAIGSDMLYFNPLSSVFQDLDFTWDFSFGDLTVPQLGLGASPQSSNASGTSKATSQGLRDTGRRHAAFKRSPWLWEPEDPIDYVQRDTEGLCLNEDESLPRPASSFARYLGGPAGQLRMTAATKDRLFSIVPPEAKGYARVPSLPSLELLDYLLQASFVYDEYHPSESWIHFPTFKPEAALPELLAAVIANGASFIAVPSIWQFGLALQEVVRIRLYVLFEGSNSNTRRLDCIQTYLMSLGIGIWSGFKRRMELSEAFFQPLVTMLRRAGAFTASADTLLSAPEETDPPDILEMKWREFVRRESYKRLALRVFLHDVQTSITFQTPPLLPFTELCFSLPAACDVWRAPSAQAWRAAYLSKPDHQRLAETSALPRISEMMHRLTIVEDSASLVDLDLCYTVLLHGFWGMVTAYRESVKFYHQHDQSPDNRRNATRRLWLESQQQELYRDICDVTNHILISPNPGLAMVAELIKMAVYVSFDELQTLAGKHGEAEARRVSLLLETTWIPSSDARFAVWHAGQVLRQARLMPPASLRNFNAMAVYFASLTLWAYSLLCGQDDLDTEGQRFGIIRDDTGTAGWSTHQTPLAGSAPIVVLDGEETRETRAFLQLNRGVPGLSPIPTDISGARRPGEPEPLTNQGIALEAAGRILRENFPVSSEPLPPLVDSLASLLQDLGSGLGERHSTAGSENGDN